MSEPAPLFNSIAAYLRYFRRIHERTVEVVGAIPPHQLEWRPLEGEWSLADIARHIPSIYRMNFSRVMGRPLRYPGHAGTLGRTLPEIVNYLRGTYDEVTAQLAEQPDAILNEQRRLADGHQAPGWLILLANVEHTVHHRSQIATYLKILGVEPPALYGVYAEQLPTE
jgi:uncharacterized damage-inducible protein DinB